MINWQYAYEPHVYTSTAGNTMGEVPAGRTSNLVSIHVYRLKYLTLLTNKSIITWISIYRNMLNY